jgi:hypothetical protein
MSTMTVLRGALTATALVAVAGCAIPSTTPSTPSTRYSATAAEAPTATVAPPTLTPPPITHRPVPADFRIEVVVTSKKCFGSAGCSYQYEIDPTYTNPTPMSQGTTYTVVYTVTGGDQDQIGKFTIDSSGTARYDTNVGIDGQDGTTFRATATRVMSNG